MHLDIAMLGFGNVSRALARLLVRKAETVQAEYGLTFRVTGIATRSHGIAIDPEGIDLVAALHLVEDGKGLDSLHQGAVVPDALTFLDRCPADMVMEATWLDPCTGQPATDYVRKALSAGRHVVTANKGPIAFAYQDLRLLAQQQDVGFFFESTVMDGAPVLGIGREGLLASTVHRIRGILNSTTNYVLTQLEEGYTLEDAIKGAQDMGIAEADPSTDLEGWDATVKTVVLANVLMGADLRPSDVDRTGVMGVTPQAARAAVDAGERVKLLCEAVREGDIVRASVRPVRLPLSDLLAQVSQTSSVVTLETDTLHHLTLVEGDTDPSTTAFGMMVDMINIARGRYH